MDPRTGSTNIILPDDPALWDNGREEFPEHVQQRSRCLGGVHECNFNRSGCPSLARQIAAVNANSIAERPDVLQEGRQDALTWAQALAREVVAQTFVINPEIVGVQGGLRCTRCQCTSGHSAERAELNNRAPVTVLCASQVVQEIDLVKADHGGNLRTGPCFRAPRLWAGVEQVCRLELKCCNGRGRQAVLSRRL